MTMRISSKQTIGEVPMTKIRDLLACSGGGFRQDWIEDQGYSLEQTTEIVEGLLNGGFIIRNEIKETANDGGIPWFDVTDLGESLIRASAAKPIRRKTAELALRRFMERVDEVNHNPQFLVRVSEVAVYGSYVRGEQLLGDLDLACRFEPKIEGADERRMAFVQHWIDAGRPRVPLGFEVRWPYKEVEQFLKNRHRTISLHEMQDFIDMQKKPDFSYQVLLGNPDSIARRLKQAEETK